MMKKLISYYKLKKVNKYDFLFSIILVFIIFTFFNTTYNSYSILLSNYEERMTQSYGYCKNESWGFQNHVIKKFNLEDKEMKIINHEGKVLIHALFENVKIVDTNFRYLIVLNFQSENDESIYDLEINNIKDYIVKYRFNNCYLLELND